MAIQLFWHRWQCFWRHIINGKSKPLGHVADYFIRVEFQMRGSPHLHMLFWILEAAKAADLLETEEGRQSLVGLVDKLIATWTIPVPLGLCIALHFCDNIFVDGDATLYHASKDQCPEQAISTEASQLALGRAISYSQLHSAECTASCFKYNPKDSATPICRFGFPKALRPVTEIMVCIFFMECI